MSKVSETTIGAGLYAKDRATLDRFRALEQQLVSKKRTSFSRAELAAFKNNRIIDGVVTAWNALSDAVKADWVAAGLISGMKGYNLFVQDKSYRVKNSIAGNATPSILHQYLIGHLDIDASGLDVHVRQTGDDTITFPLNLYLKYKSDLIVDPDDGSFIKARFTYQYLVGGNPTTQSDELSLDLSTVWKADSCAITEQSDPTGDWTLEIETHNVSGDFWFDNYYIEGAGGIITKDPLCNKVGRHFGLLKYPANVSLDSVYPAD